MVPSFQLKGLMKARCCDIVGLNLKVGVLCMRAKRLVIVGVLLDPSSQNNHKHRRKHFAKKSWYHERACAATSIALSSHGIDAIA
jgi:hypothetical protein